eukprot:CAMPEP_0181243026 /NCGR_PEP_ID=MMETSP1096-20121128/42022_1 /TAXON_ID=156174 ORGANISM="Chrysochromulina ericina, Strain CCMP281" /NCGR_SAMPLE_ID=MMETSP1096 /ASSEMBLY_ACC=CAM_ASM_000453 /LENGTH=309 /DNA_ID=CAMNT_0023339311 /DNA_START=61 /DNA_END=990 /DNA_ORIENTATION=-
MAALPPGINAPFLLWSFSNAAWRVCSRRTAAVRKLASSSGEADARLSLGSSRSGSWKSLSSELSEESEPVGKSGGATCVRASISSTRTSFGERLSSMTQAALSRSKKAAVQSVTNPLQAIRRSREALAAVGDVLLDDIKGNPDQRRASFNLEMGEIGKVVRSHAELDMIRSTAAEQQAQQLVRLFQQKKTRDEADEVANMSRDTRDNVRRLEKHMVKLEETVFNQIAITNSRIGGLADTVESIATATGAPIGSTLVLPPIMSRAGSSFASSLADSRASSRASTRDSVLHSGFPPTPRAASCHGGGSSLP